MKKIILINLCFLMCHIAMAQTFSKYFESGNAISTISQIHAIWTFLLSLQEFIF